MSNFKFDLGLEAEDVITGFKGIIIYRVEYLTGCAQYGLQPKIKKGDKDIPESRQVDENRLRLTGKSVALPVDEVEEEAPVKGGPQIPIRSARHVGRSSTIKN